MNSIEEVQLDSCREVENTIETARVLRNYPTGATLNAWAAENQQMGEIGARRFHYIYEQPDDWSGNTVVAGGEFANGVHPGMIVRALIVRESVDPHASLLIQPNSTISQTAHNFSKEEKGMLFSGNTAPIVDRLHVALGNQQHQTHEAGLCALYGPSQAAAVMSAYAAHPGVEVPIALTVVEAPHTHERSGLTLAKEFAGSGAALADNIAANFEAVGNIDLHTELMAGIDRRRLFLYGVGALRLENSVLSGIMRRNRLAKDISMALAKGGSVVHAWGTKDTVSGDVENAAIADQMAREDRYLGVRINGKQADHSITNRYALNGLLARFSVELLKNNHTL